MALPPLTSICSKGIDGVFIDIFLSLQSYGHGRALAFFQLGHITTPALSNVFRYSWAVKCLRLLALVRGKWLNVTNAPAHPRPGESLAVEIKQSTQY